MLPVFFIGHGNPMNAIEENSFTHRLQELGKEIYPKPKAILVISAHWLANASYVSSVHTPGIIYDFYGFPEELYEVRYPCLGAPSIAAEIIKQIPAVQEVTTRGIDHGAWTILKHMYPQADIPVLQLSIDRARPLKFHFELGKQLRFLREENVLIIGSGNIVHNLQLAHFEDFPAPYPWAVEFDEWVKQRLIERSKQLLIDYYEAGPCARYSVPTEEHYIPLLYSLGASYPREEVKFVYEGIAHSSIGMRCIQFGV